MELQSAPDSGTTSHILPVFAPLYAALDKVAFTAIRVVTGLLLLPHGAQKLFGLFGGSLDGTAGFLGSVGYPAPYFLAVLIGAVEFFGGLMLVFGFLTRPAAVAVAIFMAFAAAFHMTHFGSFFWTSKGFEYPLLWGIVAAFIAVKGGGRYSIDRRIGREF